MNIRPISFPNWKVRLAQSSLIPALQAAFTREILTFLKYCKTRHAPATTELAKLYLAWREAQATGPAREALRWFYKEGLKAMNRAAADSEAEESLPRATAVPEALPPPTRQPTRPLQPPPAAGDRGAQPWEQALIKASRERNFSWRTEQTYREWAVRFARFIAPRSPSAAAGEDVAAFLSAMAVEGRASPSSQKQALNALVFLMEHALNRELGEMAFKRAYPSQRVPTVLSGGETSSLFAQLTGTPRLMAELAYGSGLRLLELLRLRIHHLDLERQRLQVYAGKGDRVNGFANAAA